MKLCLSKRCGTWSKSRVWRRLMLVFLVLSLPSISGAESPAQIDRLSQQWLDIERQTNHLQSDWRTQRPLLTQRLTLLKAEKNQLQALLNKSTEGESDVDTRRAELLAQQTILEQQQVQLSKALSLLLARGQSMQAQLPPILAKAWKEEQSGLNAEAETSQQLQMILAQLTQLSDFDQRVSVHETMITAADGRPVLVKQLFLGVGMAWFTSRDGQQAGWGQGSEGHWEWHFDDSVYADDIAKAIAIFEKNQTADLVRLPIHLASQTAHSPVGTQK